MAERKLGFQVVFGSSEDPDYGVVELNFHSPQTKGWQAARFCEYPQELGIQFLEGLSTISQVQLLSHQSKIATRIELFTGQGPDYFHCQWTRLGYLSLDSNERSQYRARELKSVYVKARGQFMKFVVHKCYLNQLNLYNQVGLIAINIIGRPGVDDAVAAAVDDGGRGKAVIPPRPGVAARGGAGVNDLAVDMGMDPETAALLRDVNRRKDAAVASEDYELAKRLKVLQESIKNVGGTLAALVNEKARAVEDEDYDKAARLKDEVGRIRSMLSTQLAAAGIRYDAADAGGGRVDHTQHSGGGDHGQHGSAYDDGGGGADPSPQRVGGERAIRPAAGGASLYSQARPDEEGSDMEAGNARRGGDAAMAPTRPAPAARSPGGLGYDGRPVSRQIRPAKQQAYDETPSDAEGPQPSTAVPTASGGIKTKAQRAAELAARESPTKGSDAEDESPFGAGSASGAGAGRRADAALLAGVDGVADLPAPDPLSAAAAKDAGPAIDLFGEYVAQCLYSKPWQLREAAISKMAIEVPTLVTKRGTHDVFASCMTIIANVAKSEKIAAVFSAATSKLMPVVFSACSRDLRKAEAQTGVEPLLPLLVEKLGDNVARVRESAVAAILELAAQPSVGSGHTAGFVLRKMSKKQASSVRALQTRVELLRDLVASHNLLAPATGVSTDALVSYCAEQGCFAHANADIRQATEQLAAAIFKTGSKDLVPRLTKLLRPKQMEEYQALFQGGGGSAAAAGKPAAAPVAASGAKPAPASKGAPAGKPAPSPAGRAGAPAPAAATALQEQEGVCQFCGGCGPHATEAQLDLHYWQACPMLTACPRCQQIVEIATLQEHLLDECEHKAGVDPCDRCGDAVEPALMVEHKREWFCKPLPPIDVGNRCPLCHLDIPPEKEGWMQHLAVGAGCSKNLRTRKV